VRPATGPGVYGRVNAGVLGSAIVATRRNRPPQSGHASTSTAKVRRRSSAQAPWRGGRSWRAAARAGRSARRAQTMGAETAATPWRPRVPPQRARAGAAHGAVHFTRPPQAERPSTAPLQAPLGTSRTRIAAAGLSHVRSRFGASVSIRS
jgi:hypothetical protein